MARDKLTYAGIGSRKTPGDICTEMWAFAYRNAPHLILRSGNAKGADITFQSGAAINDGELEVYLPWMTYNAPSEDPSWACPWRVLDEPKPEAYEIAKQYHQFWNRMGDGGKKLHARNAHIVLGENLDDPVDFIVCWTPDGGRSGLSRESGGTGQALRIAYDRGIEVYNLQRPEDLEAIRSVG